MADVLTAQQRRECMRAVRDRDTKPEMRVRRITHRMGYRYALHKKSLPGSPDLVFASRRKVIFVHGCFWHMHSCNAGRKTPESNREYWLLKRSRNATRDRANVAALKAHGWRVLVLWECETRSDTSLQARIKRFLDS